MKLPDIPGRIMAQMGYRSAKEDKEQVGRCLGWCRNRYVECNNDPDDITQDSFSNPIS